MTHDRPTSPHAPRNHGGGPAAIILRWLEHENDTTDLWPPLRKDLRKSHEYRAMAVMAAKMGFAGSQRAMLDETGFLDR
nr:hypothetical protein [Allorhizobium ampelinum]